MKQGWMCAIAAAALLRAEGVAGDEAGRRFACADYTAGKVFIVGADGRIEWEHPAKNCNDLWVLPNGNLLFTTGRGVLEVTRETKEVFRYDANSEIYACQRLPNGATFVGECNAGRLLEIAPDGCVLKEIHLLAAGVDGGHHFMRNARRLPNGHYLVCHYGAQVVREYDADGRVVREIPAAGGPHSAVRLPNGNTVISCGDRPGGSRVFEVDADGATVWQVADGDLPGVPLKFMAGFHRLPNGNTLMSNWLGHGQFGKAPHLIEVTPRNEVVWTFSDHVAMRTISTVIDLGVDGDPTAGAIHH